MSIYIFEKLWKELLHDVLSNGSTSEKDDAEIIEKIGNHVFIYNPYYHMPYRDMMTEEKFAEAVQHGVFDIREYPLKSEALYDYVTSIKDEDKIYLLDDQSFIYTYPCRLRNYFQHDFEYDAVNQLDIILNRLVTNKGSNRAIATTLIPQWDGDREDIPCLQSFQCLIRDDELILSVFFRSNDLYGAWVSNMMFLTYVGLYLTRILRQEYPQLIFKGIDYHSSSLHIYKTDVPQARQVIGD